MKKILLVLFLFLTLVSIVPVEAKYGQAWMREYGCKKKCVEGGYVPPGDRYKINSNGSFGAPCPSCTSYYTPIGVKVVDLGDLKKDTYDQGFNPAAGQLGYLSGSILNAAGNIEPCFNSGCFDRNSGALMTVGGIHLDGYGSSFSTAPSTIAGQKFIQLTTYGGGDGGGGGSGGTPTIIWVTATPTPTPTPTPAPGPWIKLKDSSFLSGERIQSYVPVSPVAYDSDDTTQPYFIVGQGGVVAAPSLGFTGLNSSAKANASDWQDGSYQMIPAAATAYLLTHRLPAMMSLAAIFASFSGVVGLYLSYYLSIASGAAIVLTATAIFMFAFLWKHFKKNR